jgi:hypothetical protein
MKILTRLAVAFAAVIVIALGALAILLPRIVKSEAVRARIETAAYDALGRELRYRDLEVGLLPPALEVVEASVAGATPEAPALLEARQIALRVALLPLLARAVVIDSLVVEGARIRLVRTPEGLELPVPPGGGVNGEEPPAAKQPPAGDPTQTGEAEEGSAVAIALREVALRDARIVLEDRAVEPAVTWELRDIDVTARGESLDAPIDLDASFVLGSGGSVEAHGTATLAGDLDVTIDLSDLALAPARPYLGEGAVVEGSLGGTVSVKGPAANPDLVAIDLSLADALFTLDDITLRGPVAMRADVGSAATLPKGRFELDASDAELRYGEVFTKPPGTRASVSGRIVSAADGRRNARARRGQHELLRSRGLGGSRAGAGRRAAVWQRARAGSGARLGAARPARRHPPRGAHRQPPRHGARHAPRHAARGGRRPAHACHGDRRRRADLHARRGAHGSVRYAGLRSPARGGGCRRECPVDRVRGNSRHPPRAARPARLGPWHPGRGFTARDAPGRHRLRHREGSAGRGLAPRGHLRRARRAGLARIRTNSRS